MVKDRIPVMRSTVPIPEDPEAFRAMLQGHPNLYNREGSGHQVLRAMRDAIPRLDASEEEREQIRHEFDTRAIELFLAFNSKIFCGRKAEHRDYNEIDKKNIARLTGIELTSGVDDLPLCFESSREIARDNLREMFIENEVPIPSSPVPKIKESRGPKLVQPGQDE